MGAMTFGEKQWNDVRPASVKDGGVSAAIKAVVKLLPAGKVDGLKTNDACMEALERLAALNAAFTNVLRLVANAKDDKEGAAAKLKHWIDEVKDLRDDVAGRQGKLEMFAADIIAKAASDRWKERFKEHESSVQGVVDIFKSCDQNQGQAEGILKESIVAMVERAGTLREQGHMGVKPEDYLDDLEFKKMYGAWNEQVDKWVKAAKSFEAAAKDAVKLCAPIDAMKKEIDEAAAQVGDRIDGDTDACKKFKALKAKVDIFYQETRTDRAKRYQSFRFVPTTTGSNEFPAEQQKLLATSFASMKKVDATSYLDEQMAKYGFDRKQLHNTVAKVKAWNVQVDALARKLDGSSGKEAKRADDPAVADAVKKLLVLQDELQSVDQKYKRGRANQELANQLAAKNNADYAEEVAKAMKFFAESAAEPQRILALVQK